MKKIFIVMFAMVAGIVMAVDSTVISATCGGTTVATSVTDKQNGYIESIKILTTGTTTTNTVSFYLDGEMIYTNAAVVSGTIVRPRATSVNKLGADTNSPVRFMCSGDYVTMICKGAVATQTNTVTSTIKIDNK